MKSRMLMWTVLGVVGGVTAAVIVGLVTYRIGLHHRAGNELIGPGMRAYRFGALTDGRGGFPLARSLLLFVLGGALGAIGMYAYKATTQARPAVAAGATAADWQRFDQLHRYAHGAVPAQSPAAPRATPADAASEAMTQASPSTPATQAPADATPPAAETPSAEEVPPAQA